MALDPCHWPFKLIFISSLRHEIENSISGVQHLNTTTGSKVGMKDIVSLASKYAYTGRFIVLSGNSEIEIESAFRRGNPVKAPPHSFLIFLNIFQGSPGNDLKRDVSLREMVGKSVEMISPK